MERLRPNISTRLEKEERVWLETREDSEWETSEFACASVKNVFAYVPLCEASNVKQEAHWGSRVDATDAKLRFI